MNRSGHSTEQTLNNRNNSHPRQMQVLKTCECLLFDYYTKFKQLCIYCFYLITHGDLE